jgi:Family of unknown function (DUF5992)
MKKILNLIALTSMVISGYSYAGGGYLVQNGVINRIDPNWSAQDGFVVRVTGGTGPCVGSGIVFPLSSALVDGTSDAAHKRLYAAALTALTTGMKVDLYNDVDGANTSDPTICHRANFLYLKK